MDEKFLSNLFQIKIVFSQTYVLIFIIPYEGCKLTFGMGLIDKTFSTFNCFQLKSAPLCLYNNKDSKYNIKSVNFYQLYFSCKGLQGGEEVAKSSIQNNSLNRRQHNIFYYLKWQHWFIFFRMKFNAVLIFLLVVNKIYYG